ncbi:hypothetical protein B9Z55_012384 [Caenorhabditis nigoni]|uniref:RING-type domain-containing protein n=1 Tax=Caenorhabditis nigoni TaxID=1611254 RepID=A0A2G5TXI8_9PELO|nr:hypothetical protein B9Z55_012384 [Caenorhabditis nigoni]
MNHTGTKKHNDTKFQIYEMREGEEPLLPSRAGLEIHKCNKLESKMFYLDTDDYDKCSMQNRENLKCLDRFVKNVNPNKKFYLRQLPILRSMTDKEPRFFLEEVVEIASLLWRRSSNSCKEMPEPLQKYEETVLASSSDEIVPKLITKTQVEQIFEDCDIDKKLVTITPDVDFTRISEYHLGYITQLYITDRRGKRFVYPALAIYKIFNKCVLGVNWTTNTCKLHRDCNEKRRKAVIKLMNKYTSSSMNLIPLDDVQLEIDILRINECYLDENTSFMEDLCYLYGGYKHDESADLVVYKEIINKFHLPKNGPLAQLRSAPMQGIRFSILLGFIIQFIGPINKDNELLANVLVSNLEFSIAKDNKIIDKIIAFTKEEVVVRGRDGTRKIFKPYGAQEDNRNQSKYEKMAEKARLRKLAVQQKKNKKGGKQNPVKERENNFDAPETHNQLIDLFGEKIDFSAFESRKAIYFSKATIKGHTFWTNYSLLKNGPRKDQNREKFFLINVDEWQKLKDMESMMGFTWTKDEKYLEDLESYVTLTGSQKFVIRCFEDDSLKYVLREEAMDIMRIIVKFNGADPDVIAKVLVDESENNVQQNINKHVHKIMDFKTFENSLDSLGIDKSTITVIPDVVGKLSEANAEEHIYSSTVTIGRKGIVLMNIYESALYIFKKVVCGVDWIVAVGMNGIAAYHDFRELFEKALKPLFCEWKKCYISRGRLDHAINTLKRHKIFENQDRSDLIFFQDFAEGYLLSMEYFSEQCDMFRLPLMPKWECLPSGILVEEAKVLIMVVWACQFFPNEEISMVDGDIAMQRGVTMNAMFARLPRDSVFHNHLGNLLKHWSKSRSFARKTEPTKLVQMQNQQAMDEEADRKFEEPFPNKSEDVPKSSTMQDQSSRSGQEPAWDIKLGYQDSIRFMNAMKNSSQSADQKKIIEMMQNQFEAQRKMNNAKHSVEPPEALAKSDADLNHTTVEPSSSSQSINGDVQNNSGKTSKSTKSQKESLEKTERAQEPKKEDEDNSKESFSKSTKPQEGPTKKSKSKTSVISKEPSRSPSTSTSEPCSSQKPIPETREKNQSLLDEKAVEKKKFEHQEKKMVKMQNQIKELKEQVKQLSEENETLKGTIEERKEEDSNKLRKAKKELEKEKEKTSKLEQAIKDWKVSLEFMEKDLIEAGEQRDIANEKLRKADEELREQTARSRNLEHQLKEANKTLAMMNKEKDRAVERVVREWTERWNVERHQVQLAQNRTVEAESKARQLMKENVKLLEKKSGDGSHLPAHVATYKEDIRKLRQLLKEKEDLIPHLQRRVQELSNQPGPSSQVSEDPHGYLEKIRSMLEIINRDDSIAEKRVRISRLLTNTDSADTRSLCVLEEDLFDASVTMYRVVTEVYTLHYNMFKVQQTQSTSECQPIPRYPDLSERFLDAENKERMKPMFGEGECAICFEKIEEHDEERKCPNEICALSYHGKCILKSIKTMPSCPYCKTPYYNVDDFPVLS